MLGRLGLVAEIENPKDYGVGTKNFITILVAAGGAAAPMASTIVFRESDFYFYLYPFMIYTNIFPSFPSA